MSKTFITGDRSMGPAYPILVSAAMLRAVAQGDAIATGENGGVEEMVRGLGQLAGIQVEVIPGGKPDFDTRHAAVYESGAKAVVIHVDPHASSLTPSLLSAFAGADDDRVTLMGVQDLLA